MFNGNVRPTDLIIRVDTKSTSVDKCTNFLIFLVEKMNHNAFDFQISTLLLDFHKYIVTNAVFIIQRTLLSKV